MTRDTWALCIPAVAAAAFIFMFIPQLSAYLSKRYGAQYESWAGRTKRLIPFIY
jgi:protein-S-isoprenylcysteine O-methyltransferase Ste14